MGTTWSSSMTPQYSSGVLSAGIMSGAAILLPALERGSAFYRYLILCIFLISTFAYIVLNWETTVILLFSTLTVIGAVLVMMTPNSDVSVLSLLCRILPFMMMTMIFLVNEYLRQFVPASRQGEREPVPKPVPPSAKIQSDEKMVSLSLGCLDQLLAYTNGGETQQYRAPSQGSSDISLTTAEPGRLPSSCDSMTRSFWRDD